MAESSSGTGGQGLLDELLELRDRAYMLACRALGSREGADDALQQAYLQAIRHIRQGAEVRNLRAWFMNVVINSAREHARAETRRRRREAAVENHDRSPSRPRAEMVEALDRCVTGLQEKHRLAIALCYEQGLTQREAAEALGVPLGTLATNVNRALERLRAALAGAGFHSAPAVIVAGLAEAPKLAAPAGLTAAIQGIVKAGVLPARPGAGSRNHLAGKTTGAKVMGISAAWKAVTVVGVTALAAGGALLGVRGLGGRKILPAATAVTRAPFARPEISLNGKWQFSKLGERVGDTVHRLDTKLGDIITVPGAVEAQAKGIVGLTRRSSEANRAMPFKETDYPFMRKVYPGMPWYKKVFTLPPEWRGKRMWLELGGVYPVGEIWVNGRKLRTHLGGSLPDRFDVTKHVKLGGPNVLAVKILPYALDKASVGYGGVFSGYGWQCRWKGIYRGVRLYATADLCVSHVAIFPNLAKPAATIVAELSNSSARRIEGQLTVTIVPWKSKGSGGQGEAPFAVEPGGMATVRLTVPVKDARLWWPDEPNLYLCHAQAAVGGAVLDGVTERFGMREVQVKGTRILLNGKPLLLRGAGNALVQAISVSPTADKAEALRQVRLMKSYGFNYMRHWNHVASIEELEAADEEGFFRQEEGFPTSPCTTAYWKEVIRRDANHPSVIVYCGGNEAQLSKKKNIRTLNEFGGFVKSLDPSRLWLANDGCSYPNRFPTLQTDMFCAWTRFRDSFYATARAPAEAGILAELRSVAAMPKPFIVHEHGGYVGSYPNIANRPLYKNGYGPHFLDYLADQAKKRGVPEEDLIRLAHASERTLGVQHRQAIEVCRRTDVAGYCIWTWFDYAKQFTQGVMYDLGRPKATPPSDYAMVNADVLLLTDQPKLTFNFGEEITRSVFLSNYGRRELAGDVAWELRRGEEIVGTGSLRPGGKVAPGELKRLGEVRVKIPALPRASMLTLWLFLGKKDSPVRTFYKVWAFPPDNKAGQRGWKVPVLTDAATLSSPLSGSRPLNWNSVAAESLVVAGDVSDRLLQHVRRGGRALVLVPLKGSKSPRKFAIRDLDFAVLERHPALGGMPHEGFADAHLFGRRTRSSGRYHGLVSRGVDIRALPRHAMVTPIVWGASGHQFCGSLHKIGLPDVMAAFEFRMGKGGMLVAALNLDASPEGKGMLAGLLNYCAGPKFAPKPVLDQKDFLKLCPAAR